MDLLVGIDGRMVTISVKRHVDGRDYLFHTNQLRYFKLVNIPARWKLLNGFAANYIARCLRYLVQGLYQSAKKYLIAAGIDFIIDAGICGAILAN